MPGVDELFKSKIDLNDLIAVTSIRAESAYRFSSKIQPGEMRVRQVRPLVVSTYIYVIRLCFSLIPLAEYGTARNELRAFPIPKRVCHLPITVLILLI